MNQKHKSYSMFMDGNFPQDAHGQWNKCMEFTKIMQAAFPELSIRKGYVYSKENQDNAHPDFPKQYPHAWLTDENGNIVDPTVFQFCMLGKLHYVEATAEEMRCRCEGCGQYSGDKRFCGKCPWSEPEVDAQSFITDIQKLAIDLKLPVSHGLISQECRVVIEFKQGKPATALWDEWSQDRNRIVKTSSPFREWKDGFLHFYSGNETDIKNELKISEQFLLERNLDEVIDAKGIFSSGTYILGKASDFSDV